MPANRIVLRRNQEVSGIGPPRPVDQLILFNASSIQEWKVLPCPYTFSAGNHESGHRAGGYMNHYKPEPVDSFTQHRISCSENTVDKSCPNKWHRDAAQQDRMSRKHGQNGAIQESDQHRRERDDRSSYQERVPMESRELRDCHSLRKESAGEKVCGIPNAIVAEHSPSHRETYINEAARQTSFESRRYWVDLKWQPRSMLVAGHLISLSYCRAFRRGRSSYECRDRFHLLAREKVSEPSNTTTENQHCSKDANESCGDQPRESQCEAEREDDGPESICRQRYGGIGFGFYVRDWTSGFILPVRVLRVLEVPERAAAVDYRYGCEVVCRWR